MRRPSASFQSRCRAVFGLTLGLLLPLVAVQRAHAQTQPNFDAPLKIAVSEAEDYSDGDRNFVELVRNNPRGPDSLSTRLQVSIYGHDVYQPIDPALSGVELRYTVRNVPVSPWLAPPFAYLLSIDNSAIESLPDGFSHVSVEVRGARAAEYQPRAIQLLLSRGRAVSQSVPLVDDQGGYYGPSAVYVDAQSRNWRGYPVSPVVTPWQAPPYEADLYLELMEPHTPLFVPAQMWWEHPLLPGAPFIRGMPPMHGEDHRGIRVNHERFPSKDGLRGVGWMSAYSSGAFRTDGTFVFAETGGRIGLLKPDGTQITLAGWRVNPQKDPVWIKRTLAEVHANMELRGRWLQGVRSGELGGMRTPLDVALDPQNENVVYVAGYEDNCIWRLAILDSTGDLVDVTVLAGDPGHASGFADGPGHAARFSGPASLVFDPVSDRLYVADQDNDSIRAVSRSGVVTTVFGQPNMAARLTARGVTDVYNQLANRQASSFEVSAAAANAGNRPEIYRPQTVRVDSRGNILVLELGFGSIRRIVPATGEAKKMAEIRQKFAEWDRGWAWFDVDRWGNAGPKDGIYWVKFVGATVDGDTFDHFNEIFAWVPPEGGLSKMIFPRVAYYELWPDGWGPLAKTNQPHYPWLIAVDPRGAVLMGGGGHHGVVRMRLRKADDPVPLSFDDQYNHYELGGGRTWLAGTPSGSSTNSASFALRYGWEGHNYLGFMDAWALVGATDGQILDAYNVPAHIRTDQAARADFLLFVRLQASPNTPGGGGNGGGGDGNVNTAPRVNAGRDISARMRRSSVTVRVAARVADDGLPARRVTGRWSVVRGKNVKVARAGSAKSDVVFRKRGRYVLRFTASDGKLRGWDDVQVTVK